MPELFNTTIQRFNSLFLHDSRLVGVSLFRVEEEDRVKLRLTPGVTQKVKV